MTSSKPPPVHSPTVTSQHSTPPARHSLAEAQRSPARRQVAGDSAAVPLQVTGAAAWSLQLPQVELDLPRAHVPNVWGMYGERLVNLQGAEVVKAPACASSRMACMFNLPRQAHGTTTAGLSSITMVGFCIPFGFNLFPFVLFFFALKHEVMLSFSEGGRM